MRGRRRGPGRVHVARWAILAVLFALVAGGPTVPLVTAYHTGTLHPMGASVNETVAIPVNNWTAYDTTLTSTDKVAFNVQVTSGSEIDLYIVPPGGYAQYQDHSSPVFSTYRSLENSLRFQGTFGDVSGRVIFIVDNVDFSGARPHGNVTVRVFLARIETTTPVQGEGLLFCGLLLAVSIITPIAAVLYNRRKKRAQMQRFPPPQPVQSQGYPPPPPVVQAPAPWQDPPPPPPPPPPP